MCIRDRYLGRTDFIERLESAARAAGAEFVEVFLDLEEASAVSRFTERRRVVSAHPESDVPDVEIADTIANAKQALDEVIDLRPGARTLHAESYWSIDDTLETLLQIDLTARSDRR